MLAGHRPGAGLLFRGSACGAIVWLFLFNPRFGLAVFILTGRWRFALRLRVSVGCRFGFLWFEFLFELLREIDNISHTKRLLQIELDDSDRHLRPSGGRSVRARRIERSQTAWALTAVVFRQSLSKKLGFRFQGKIGLVFEKGEAKVKNPHPKGGALREPPIGGQSNRLRV